MTTNHEGNTTMQFHTSVETITPQMAKDILERNINNRSPKWGKVHQYALDITAGRWKVNGESIKFSPSGRLLDGQNRMWAVVEADQPIETVIAWNVDDDAQVTVDTGVQRSFADVLRMRGIKNSVAVAAVTRSVHILIHSGSFNPKQLTPSHQALSATFDSHPEILEQSGHLSTIAKNVHLPLAIMGGLWWRFKELDASDAEFFWERLNSDVDQQEGDPIYALRRVLTNLNERSNLRVLPQHMAAFVIKAWNAYRDGTQVKTLQYRPGGANPEKFPEPR